MESLALLVSVIVLGRIAFVSLCVALTIYTLHYRYVDGLLQTRPGLPSSPIYVSGLIFAVGTIVTLLIVSFGR